MKITLNRTPDQLALFKGMSSKNPVERAEARTAFAAFVNPVILEVIQQANLVSNVYRDLEFDQNSDASIPLDLYYDQSAGSVSIWSQSIAGGLASNFFSGINEIKLSTYSIDTAFGFLLKWIEQSRLDVVAKTLTKVANEILIRQNDNGWSILFKALANGNTRNLQHVFRTNTSGILILDDFLKLATRSKRILASYNNGTPDPQRAVGVTDLYVSPEIIEQVRAMAYQPMNTRNGSGTGATSIPAPESFREEVFRNTGLQSLYGITLHELNELGAGFAYNSLFGHYAGSTAFTEADGTSSSGAFTPATEQILVGIDATRDSLVRPVQVDSETRGQLVVEEDDSFTRRSGKMGYFAKIEEGRACIDNRALQGLIV